MTEKYDVVDITREAGGGEYLNQDGFGWTNGIALKLSVQAQAARDPSPRQACVRSGVITFGLPSPLSPLRGRHREYARASSFPHDTRIR